MFFLPSFFTTELHLVPKQGLKLQFKCEADCKLRLNYKRSQVRSGQVRSECLTCTFRASCCCARLSRAQVPAFTGSSVRDRKKRGEGVRAVLQESVVGGGWFEVLWNLECPVELSQSEICAHFNEGNLVQFGRSAESVLRRC